MSRKLFWLIEEQWARIEPHLPTDVRGAAIGRRGWCGRRAAHTLSAEGQLGFGLIKFTIPGRVQGRQTRGGFVPVCHSALRCI